MQSGSSWKRRLYPLGHAAADKIAENQLLKKRQLLKNYQLVFTKKFRPKVLDFFYIAEVLSSSDSLMPFFIII